MKKPICHQFLISPLIGGAARVALAMAKQLQIEGTRCRMWFPSQGDAKEFAETECGISSGLFPFEAAMGRGRIRAALANFSVWKVLSGRDTVHVHSPIVYGSLSRALAFSKARRVVHLHSEADLDGLDWAFRTPPDLVISCAKFLEDKLRSTVNFELNSITIPNPVDLASSSADGSEVRNRIGAALDKPLLLMLSNLSPIKGQDVAIRALSEDALSHSRAELWLAGAERGHDKGYTEKLKTLAAELGVEDRVRFLGFRDDCADLLKAADLMLLPSQTEGMPLTILEAHKAGTPVIATSVGGVPEIVTHEQTGLLAQPGNATELASGIARLLSDPKLYESIATAAHRQVEERHSINAYCNAIRSAVFNCAQVTTRRVSEADSTSSVESLAVTSDYGRTDADEIDWLVETRSAEPATLNS